MSEFLNLVSGALVVMRFTSTSNDWFARAEGSKTVGLWRRYRSILQQLGVWQKNRQRKVSDAPDKKSLRSEEGLQSKKKNKEAIDSRDAGI